MSCFKRRLEIKVTLFVSVFFPMWFKIKVKHSWMEGPRHILTGLGLVQTQKMQVILEYLHGTSTVVSPLDCDDLAT